MIVSPEHTLILIVDDNPTNCELLHRRLTRQGYSCEVAHSGIEMLRMVESRPPNLILLDLMMPEMDGIEVLRILRETHDSATLPVLMVTARNVREDIVAAFEAGANDYVEKPVDFPVLLARLRQHLEHKRLRDEVVRSRAQLQEKNRQWQASHEQRLGLMSFVSRELQPPVQALCNAARQIQSDKTNATNRLAQIAGDEIQASSRYLARLVQDLQDMAELDSGGVQLLERPTDTYVLINSTLQSLCERAESRGIQLSVAIQEALDIAAYDPDRLQQVLRNLVGMALDYTADGADLAFTAMLDEEGRLRLQIEGPFQLQLQHNQFLPAFTLNATHTFRRAATGLAFTLLRKLADLHCGELALQADLPDDHTRLILLLAYRPVATD